MNEATQRLDRIERVDARISGYTGKSSEDETTSIDMLVRALRYPALVFGPASPAALEAKYEEGDWSLARDELNAILDGCEMAPAQVMQVLRAASRFVELHALRLSGHPWLNMMRFEDAASISYVVHLDLDREDANVWNERFLEMLCRRNLLNNAFHMNLRKRGPTV